MSSVKGHTVNVLGFAGHTEFVATTQFCFGSMKVAMDNR